MKYINEKGRMFENKFRLEDLPDGPFYFVSQHDEKRFLEDPLLFEYVDIKENFEYRHGTVVYCYDENLQLIKVGGNYDSSD